MVFDFEKINLVAKTFTGLESVLAKELVSLGFENIQEHNRAVSFDSDLQGLYKANLSLRTALRVLFPLGSRELKNEKELYDFAYEIEWENIFKTTDKFLVVSVIKSNLYRHTNYPALLVKDAIADRFRDKLGSRPSVGKNNPEIVIVVHVFGNSAEIFLDSSGEPLNRRGYRIERVKAPLNEVLAAGLIYLSEWNKKDIFIDPMCGSGTLPIEAAMIARNVPPNLYRKNFSFRNWKNFDLPLFTKTKNLLKREIKESAARIIGNDISEAAINIAKNNAARAKVLDFIEFNRISFFEYVPPKEKKHVLFNPPYDERIKIQDTIAFYRKIGDTLKRNYGNSITWILSGNKRAIKQIGLSADAKFTLDNGGMESYFRKYEIYEGSKKTTKEKKSDNAASKEKDK